MGAEVGDAEVEGGLQRERYPERGAIELVAPGKDFEAEQWFV